jgi:hypothetical protein
MLADLVVPALMQDAAFRQRVKDELVDPLIEYGRFALGLQETVSTRAEHIAQTFISSCGSLGAAKDKYVRSNGEEY